MVWGLTAVALVARLAFTEAIHLPPWPMSPDGEVFAAEGPAGLAVQAEGARVEPLGGGLWRVLPAPETRRVRLRAGAATAEAEVEPPTARIAIEATPQQLVKGRDRGAELRIAVLDAAGQPDPAALEPVIVCSAGAVRDIAVAGPGRFTARYDLPAARHPELAVITALSPRCPLCATPRAVGTVVLPLAAAIDLPGHTEPHVQVTVTVGGRTFGPVTADGAGNFRVPVVVPPGEHLAEGVSIDKLGTRVSQVLDLHLPPVNQIACAAWPPALPADGRATAQIWCVASDLAGRPASRARLELTAAMGRVGKAEPLGSGVFRSRYQAPRGGGNKRAGLIASFPSAGPASTQEIALELATGAPAELGYSLEREPVPIGRSVKAQTWAHDGRGDPLPAPIGPRGAKVGFVAPDRFVAVSEPGDWVQVAELGLELPPASGAAMLCLRREGGEWVAAARAVDMRPAVGVALRFGSGVAAITDARGEARAAARGASETVAGDGGLRAAAWAGFGVLVPPTSLSRTFSIAIAPEAPLDVRAVAEGGFVSWRVEDLPGHALQGRAVRLEASGVRLGPVEPTREGGRCPVAGRGTVAVIDVESGVAAVVEVQ